MVVRLDWESQEQYNERMRFIEWYQKRCEQEEHGVGEVLSGIDDHHRITSMAQCYSNVRFFQSVYDDEIMRDIQAFKDAYPVQPFASAGRSSFQHQSSHSRHDQAPSQFHQERNHKRRHEGGYTTNDHHHYQGEHHPQFTRDNSETGHNPGSYAPQKPYYSQQRFNAEGSFHRRNYNGPPPPSYQFGSSTNDAKQYAQKRDHYPRTETASVSPKVAGQSRTYHHDVGSGRHAAAGGGGGGGMERESCGQSSSTSPTSSPPTYYYQPPVYFEQSSVPQQRHQTSSPRVNPPPVNRRW